MAVPSAADLRRGKQVIPTARLIRWAEEAGFDIRRSNGGTSHIRCRHKEHRDIQFGIIAGSAQLGSQHSFSDALRELERRAMPEKTQETRLTSFKNAASNQEFLAKIPAYISAEQNHETGATILRDRKIPQIGITIFPGDERLVENKIRELDGYRRQAHELLGRCEGLYDVDVGMDNGVFDGTLIHKIYDIEPVMLAPYQKDELYPAFFDAVGNFTLLVKQKDEENKTRLNRLLGMDFVGAASVAFASKDKRGERTNKVDIAIPDGTSIRLEFITASMRCGTKYHDVHGGRISEDELGRMERNIAALSRLRIKQPRPALAA